MKSLYNFFHRHYHTRYHGIYRHAKQLFIFDLALLGVAILMLGAGLFFFFWKPGITDLIDVTITLGEQRVRSGETVKATITYTNRSKVKINDTVLALRLPGGFMVDRDKTPETLFSKNNTFTLEPLPPGASGQVELHGVVWAEPGSQDRILASLSYVPENKEEREQKLSTYLVNLPESVLASKLTIATSTLPNRPLAFTYTLRNNAENELGPITITSNLPLQGVATKDLKNITLKGGEEKVITGEVRLPARPRDQKVQISSSITVGNYAFKQTVEDKAVAIVTPQMYSKARLLKTVSYIEPGQELPVEITWRNSGEFSLRNPRIRVSFTPGTVDVRRTARENHFKSDGNSLIIDSNARTSLADGSPGNSDAFTFTLYLLSSFTPGTAAGAAFEIRPTVEAEIEAVSGQTFTQEGEKADAPLATDLSLRTEVRYFTPEGDQLGRGPLPPTVGETTKYWVFVQAFNTTNPVRDASFRTTLMPGIDFTGKQSVTIGPQLSYDGGSKTVSWSYRELPANSQTGLYFEVAVTPNPEQVGKTLQLTRNLNFFATDSVVGKEFSLSRAGLSNVLPGNDRGAASGAAVVAQ